MPSGQCKMCGKCCEAIHVPITAEKVAEEAATQIRWGRTDLDSDLLFIHFNWVPITKEEAFRRNPQFQINIDREEGEQREFLERFYDTAGWFTCKHLKNGLCTIHEIRPNVCSGYPWYDREPTSSMTFYSDDCGYIVDAIEAKAKEEQLAREYELRKQEDQHEHGEFLTLDLVDKQEERNE